MLIAEADVCDRRLTLPDGQRAMVRDPRHWYGSLTLPLEEVLAPRIQAACPYSLRIWRYEPFKLRPNDLWGMAGRYRWSQLPDKKSRPLYLAPDALFAKMYK